MVSPPSPFGCRVRNLSSMSVGHEAAHRSASGRDPLKKDGAIGIFGQGTLNGGDLSLNAPKPCSDALITFLVG